MKKAGVKGDYTFHSLRHTFATLALESGRSPLLVSQALGHAKVSTTLDIYWSVSKEKLDLGFLDE
jgi:integrase